MTEANRCPACGEPSGSDAKFCEVCGSALSGPAGSDPAATTAIVTTTTNATTTAATAATPTPAADPTGGEIAVPAGGVLLAVPSGTCGSCGGVDGYDPDGYCIACGMRAVRPRDRMELDLGGAGTLVAVSDKGPRKVRNEDSFALARLQPFNGDGPEGVSSGPAQVAGGLVISVCDGVSNIPRSDEASQAACDAAVAVLSGTAVESIDALHVQAAAAASAAVVALAPIGPWGGSAGIEPPSCTYLAVRWQADEGLSVGWLGDCRAYVIESGQVRQLTVDHSWGTQAVASGALSQVAADHDPRSHAITRWLGADAQQEPIPELVRHQIVGPALLVAVSDGAWNYLDHTQQVAEFFADGDLLGGARRFTQFAIERGGHDNITVAAATLQPASGPDQISQPMPSVELS